MSAETIRRIELLHALYCQHTGRSMPLEAWRVHEWARLLQAIKFYAVEPENAVVLVANRVKRLIAKKELWDSALAFSRFVMRTDQFQEHLSAALAESRKPVRSAQLKAVEAFTGRPMEPKQAEARKADEVLNSAAFKAFCDLRKTL